MRPSPRWRRAAGALMAPEVIHHHDIARLQLRIQDLVDIVLEELAVDGPSRTMGATMPLLRSPATKVVVVQWPCGTATRSRSPRRAAVGARHLCGGPGLVDKHQPIRIKVDLAFEPLVASAQDVRPILLRGATRLFCA